MYHPAIIAAFSYKLFEKYELESNTGWEKNAFVADYGWIDLTSLHNTDGGLMYLVADNLQLDLSAGSSILELPGNRNLFGALGISVRLPHQEMYRHHIL